MLEIILADDKRTFEPGDRVSGTLAVEVETACDCDGLSLERYWQTHGQGNPIKGAVERLSLFTGPWEANASYSYPFEFVLPAGPLSYHGEKLNVDWYLEAAADLPWAIDPTARVDLLLLERQGDPQVVSQGEHWRTRSTRFEELRGQRVQALPEGWTDEVSRELMAGRGGFTTAGQLGQRVFVGVVLFMLVLCALLLGFGIAAAGPLGLLVGLFPTLICGGVLFFLLRNRLAERKLGPVEVSIGPARVLGPGDELTVEVGFTPKVPVEINSIEVELLGEERVVRGSGSNRRTFKHTIDKRREQLTGAIRVAAGEPFHRALALSIQSSAPASFSVRDNTLSWTLKLHIDIPRWPDWNRIEELLVLPPGVAAAARGAAPESEVPAASVEKEAPPGQEQAEAESAVPEVEPEEASAEALLAELCERLSGESFSSDRQQLIDDFKGQALLFTLIVDRVGPTSGVDAVDGYRGGSTIRGQLGELELEVQVSAERFSELRGVEPGAVLWVSAGLVGWKPHERCPILAWSA